MGTRVVAVDIGSVRPPSKFAWAAFDAPGRDVVDGDTDPQSAVSALVPGLLAGAQAALLLEAPMSVPVPAVSPMHGAGWVKPAAVKAAGRGPRAPVLARWRRGWRRAHGCSASWRAWYPGWQ